ncbi:MAG: sulfatase-like hydrolase/transferase [Nitrosopumilaceae archaeon]|nr:sulfatase-like hydrolase/transferase [Nitrosopumilaceae archaeon]
MVEIKKDVYNFDHFNWLLSLGKFCVYSLFAPLVFLLLLSIAKQKKILTKVSAVLYIIAYFAALLFILIYYKYFGFIPHYKVLSRAYEGSHLLGQVYSQLMSYEEWAIFILLFVSIGLTFKYLSLPSTMRIKSNIKVLIIVIAVVGNVGLVAFQNFRYGSSDVLVKLGSSAAVLHLGLLPVYKEIISYEMSYEKKDYPYPGKINRDNVRQDNIARFENANVVIVQIESLEKQAVDYRINGKLVMPFLHKFKSRSVYFTNFFAQHSGGASTDADLGMLASLLPLRNQVGLFSADYSRIATVVEVLKEKSYKSFAMNPIDGQFFNKNSSYPRVGLDKFYDEPYYSDQAKGWYSKDRDFYEQSMDIIKKQSSPFFAYIINIQSHGPFKNYYDSTKDNFDLKNSGLSNLQIDYLMSMNEIDRALEYLYSTLKDTGLMDNTMLLIYGDHAGRAIEDNNCLAECVPLFVYHKRLSPYMSPAPGSHLDLAPTILDLLNIPEPSGWLGTSLFYRGRKTVLFNDFTTIESDQNKLIKGKSLDYEPHLNYSNSLVK